MSRIIYQDPGITEYDDGTEEVHFSDAEWKVMMADPVRFGYACPQGHLWSEAEHNHGHCYACEAASYEAEMSEEEPVEVEMSEEPVEVPPVVETPDDDDIPF
jgi:hypothetical protein